MNFPKTPVGRLRLLAIAEGVSFLVLLFIAMPLKYLADFEHAVKVVGWAHGLLFIAFCVALALAMRAARWSWLKGAVVFVAALLPFGPFVIDRRLKQDEARPGP